MSTKIRAEISEKNPYWIDKHRYYELKHFCLQYPLWKRMVNILDGYSSHSTELIIPLVAKVYGDPTADKVVLREFYTDRIELLKHIATETDPMLGVYILKAVTEGLTYDYFKSRLEIPCCKDTYYNLYRRFFWLLSQARK